MVVLAHERNFALPFSQISIPCTCESPGLLLLTTISFFHRITA